MRRPSLVVLSFLAIVLGCDDPPTAACPDGCPAPPGSTTGHLQGIVLDDGGAPVVGALVTTSPATRSALTDAEGRFAILDLEAGPYAVVAAKEGLESSAATVQVVARGTFSVALTLPRELSFPPRGSANVFALVLGPNGAPFEGATVIFRRLGAADSVVTATGADGIALLTNHPQGFYQIEASAPIGGHDYRARTAAEARIGASTVVTLQLRRIF